MVIPNSSTRFQRYAGSRKGLPSYSTNVHPTLNPCTRKFHIIHPLGSITFTVSLSSEALYAHVHSRGCVVEEDVGCLQVGADHELLLGLQEHTACAVNDGSVTPISMFRSFNKPNNALWSSCCQAKSHVNLHNACWTRQAGAKPASKILPVVPELNRIHSGQSNGSCAHSISPLAVRPS